MVNKDTQRVHLINLNNSSITIYHKALSSNGVDYSYNITKLEKIYSEFSKSLLNQKYGYSTEYNGLIIIDGLFKYISSNDFNEGLFQEGYFTISVGDKIVNYLLNSLEPPTGKNTGCWEVKEVSEFFDSRGRFCSLEVLV